MQINMRKILAMLSVLAMLCTVLPLGVFTVSAADVNIAIPNGDFESSDLSAWKIGGGRLSTATAHGGAQSLYSADNLTAYAYSGYVPNIEVAPNSDYTVEFWFCYEATAAKTMRLYVADGGGSATTVIKAANGGSQPVAYCSDSTAGDGVWKKAHLTFNSGNQSTICLKFGGGSGGYNACYIDDIVMTGPAPNDEPAAKPEGPSDFGRIENGGFEEAAGGMTIKYASRTNADSYSGNYSLKSNSNTKYGVYAYTTFDCVANTDYKFSFKIKLAGDHTSSSTNQRLYVKPGDESATLKQLNVTDATTEWKTYSTTVNSGENTTLYFSFAQGVDNGGTCYIDDVIVEGPAPEAELPPVASEPSNDGYIVNGTFETGVLDPWTVKNGGSVAYVDNSYVLKGTATAKYDAFVQQSVTVEKNTDYLITFKAKLAASGGQIRFVVNGNGTRLNNDSYYFTSTTDWATYQIQVNSGDNTTLDLLPTQGVTGGGDIYYDDITMKKVESDAGYQGSYPEQMTSGADIRFMTYNVLVGQDTNKGGYSWGQPIGTRPEKACAMINYYKPDVIALEEFSGEWYEYFQANMTDYAFGIMESKDSQNNGILYTCLAYNKNTIRLLDTDLFRNTVSRWGTQGMRYVNVGFFEVIATGEKFIGAVTHPDAGNLVGTSDLNGDGIAEEGDGYWRPQMLEEAAAYVKGLSDEYKQPVIWGGDFNSGLEGTYDDNVSWYKVADAGFTDATAGRYIDHIFYNGMATHLYETTVADAAVNGASDHKAVFADIQFLDEFATPIKDAKDYIKTQGRNTLKDGALWLDFSASGIEFSANCEGKVALNLNVKSLKQTDSYGGLYFTVIVDGVKKDRAQCHITSTGNVELVLAENLPAGNHTFEVYRQTEHRGAEVGISSIALNGSFNEKPEDNRLYIEFIGDSISTGFGALGTTSDSDGGSPKWQDATAAYPFLTAKALGADFSDVCYSGIGAKYGWQDPNMLNFYPYQRWQYDRNTQYNFNARQPDVVVIALGTNDIAMEAERGITLEQRLAGYQELLDLVRAKNPNSKIVWIYGMMKDDDNARIPAIIEENGGAAAGLYSLELVTNTAGAGWHPSAAGQQKFADDLVAFLNSDVLVKYVGDEMLDNDEGDVVEYMGSSRMEMTADKLGLAFGFGLNIEGLEIINGTEAVLDNATVDAFGDGTQYKLVRMGAIVSNNPVVGLSDMKLADVDGKKTIDVNAKYLYDLEGTYAQFAVRITNIPVENEATVIYARAYFVIEYEGREVVIYDDTQFANYINKYEQNDGVLEW